MANGQSLYEAEKAGERFAASWLFPLGSNLKITNLENGKSVTVEITDRGPAKRLKREIDLSKSAFGDIADTRQGIIKIKIERIKG